MSQVKTILKALVKIGVGTYDELEAATKLPRNNLRWAVNEMKKNGHIKKTEEPLTKDVAWQITPAGRAHLIKIAGENIEAAPTQKAPQPIKAAMAKAKAKVAKKSNGKLQTTPAEGWVNIIRSLESESPVGAASTSPEVQAVVEQPAADDSPLPAGSNVPFYQPTEEGRKEVEAWSETKLFQLDEMAPAVEFTDPQLFAMVSIDGALHISFAGKEINLPAFAVRQLGEFLDGTQAAWLQETP